MSAKTLSLTLRHTRMGWCLSINGEAYAVGTRAYCITVAGKVRRDFALHGWAAFPEITGKSATGKTEQRIRGIA